MMWLSAVRKFSWFSDCELEVDDRRLPDADATGPRCNPCRRGGARTTRRIRRPCDDRDADRRSWLHIVGRLRTWPDQLGAEVHRNTDGDDRHGHVLDDGRHVQSTLSCSSCSVHTCDTSTRPTCTIASGTLIVIRV